MTATTGTVGTSHGTIAYAQSREEGPAILLIHSNSSAKEVFENQLAAPELDAWRVVAVDLPGHGDSQNAQDPEASYTFAGYAAMAEEVIERLELGVPVVVGWSLGGHIALEMAGRALAPLKGVMISGTPPVKPEMASLMAGFNINPDAENLTGKRDFTHEDALLYTTLTSGVDGWLDARFLDKCVRTDGRAREVMFGSVAAGNALDEREIVASMSVPLAIVNGHDDVFIRAGYFDKLTYATLWKHGVVRMEGAAHAPFLQRPAAFNSLLAEFAANL